MKTFNVSTNHTNGAGLQRDGELMIRMLESLGHKANRLQFNDYLSAMPSADVTICLEVINDKHLQWNPGIRQVPPGKQNWFVPNSEWYFPCWNGVLPRFNKILCKTQHCFNIFAKMVGAAKCVLLGFEAEDLYIPGAVKQIKFLHTAGKSETKNTKVVCEAWRKYNISYPLTISAFKPEIRAHCKDVPNLTLVERFAQHDLISAVNTHRFMLMPSKQEGFGHAIHEAAACGAAVITVDADPMRSFGVDSRLLIPSAGTSQMRAALAHDVTPEGVRDTVLRAACLPSEELDAIGERARQWFLNDRDQFRKNFTSLVANA